MDSVNLAHEKLIALREYTETQACDDGLWFKAETATEAYLQQELRRVAWLIENASPEMIIAEVERKKAQL